MLKQVGLNKSPGLDGLLDEVYLRISHTFVPVLTVMFNNWFAQGAIPGSIEEESRRYVWEELCDYRPGSLGPEQNYAVKGRSIQDNLHLVRKIIEGIEDDTEVTLISLDLSKAFVRVDRRFLATAGFELEFHKWISILYRKPMPWCR